MDDPLLTRYRFKRLAQRYNWIAFDKTTQLASIQLSRFRQQLVGAAMAKIQCPACKSIMSDRRQHASCPWCGYSLAAVYASQPFVPGARSRSWPSWRGWTIAALVGTLAGCLVSTGYDRIIPVNNTLKVEWTRKALTTCQKRIAALSISGEVPPPPDAKNYGTEPEFYFVWPKGAFYYSDSDGVLNAASASCRGDLRSGRVGELSLNGTDVTAAPLRGDS